MYLGFDLHFSNTYLGWESSNINLWRNLSSIHPPIWKHLSYEFFMYAMKIFFSPMIYKFSLPFHWSSHHYLDGSVRHVLNCHEYYTLSFLSNLGPIKYIPMSYYFYFIPLVLRGGPTRCEVGSKFNLLPILSFYLLILPLGFQLQTFFFSVFIENCYFLLSMTLVMKRLLLCHTFSIIRKCYTVIFIVILFGF